MNKKEVEGIEKVIKEYLKKNLTRLGHQLISDYYIKYKNKYEK